MTMDLRSKIYDIAISCAERQAAGGATMPEDVRRLKILKDALVFLPAIHMAGAVTHQKGARHYSVQVCRAFDRLYIEVNGRQVI